MQKKILLLQFRTDYSEDHEQECFKDAFSEHNVTFEYANAITGKLTQDLLHNKDAVIIGGSGEFYFSRGDGNNTWAKDAKQFVAQTLEKNIPTLGVCFGYQLLGMVAGGSIIRDEQKMESGTFDMTALPDASDDPVFTGLPEKFEAQVAHKDVLVYLDDNIRPLIVSERVNPHGFKVKGVDAWGVLFHPELNEKRMTQRITMYEEYIPKDSNIEEIFRDTPEAEKVLDNFARII